MREADVEGLGFTTLQPRGSLTSGMAAQIREAIGAGRLKPGERLPTEQQLIVSFGVSRTVVREAIAALRADGLVVSRQGSGVFVADPPAPPRFRLAPGGLTSLRDVIQLLELRTGIEAEAAAFAAQRRSDEHLAQMRQTLAQVDLAIAAGRSAHELDFQFHRLIAAAAGNPLFLAFLDQFGQAIIPRRSVEVDAVGRRERRGYLQRSQAEHRELHAAIEEGAASRAMRLMRQHIANGLKRYRSLQPEAAGQSDGDQEEV